MSTPKKPRKKSGPSPTELTLARLRRHGWDCQVVEQVIRRPPKFGQPPMIFHRDLWGCLDVLAIQSDPRPRILGVQACIAGHVRVRLDKAKGLTEETTPGGKPKAKPKLREWLAAGGEFQVWGWAKYGKRGERKTWECRRIGVVLAPEGKLEEKVLEG